MRYVLAVVENHGAVGPAVVVHQTQVGEQAHPDRLQPLLVAHCEAIAVDLGGKGQRYVIILYNSTIRWDVCVGKGVQIN